MHLQQLIQKCNLTKEALPNDSNSKESREEGCKTGSKESNSKESREEGRSKESCSEESCKESCGKESCKEGCSQDSQKGSNEKIGKE
jgi:hypothetical protein